MVITSPPRARTSGAYSASGSTMTISALVFKALMFIQCCELYFEYQTPFWAGASSVIDDLINVLGYEKTICFIESYDFSKKTEWLVSIYDLVPDEKIDEKVCQSILHCVSDEREAMTFYVSLKTAMRINERISGFLEDYMSALVTLGEKNKAVISWFLLSCGTENGVPVKDLINSFPADISPLCDAYILAKKAHLGVDGKGELFVALIRRKLHFLEDFIKSNRGNMDRDDLQCLEALWREEDYKELIDRAITCLRETPFIWDTLGEFLLEDVPDDLIIQIRKREWIKRYIDNNSQDHDATEFLFNIICNLSEEQRLFSIKTFCMCNSNYGDFCKVKVLPTHMSWSGSEIPIIDSQLMFLEKLSGELQGIQYIEHRVYLSDLIHEKRVRKGEVLLREFLEEF